MIKPIWEFEKLKTRMSDRDLKDLKDRVDKEVSRRWEAEKTSGESAGLHPQIGPKKEKPEPPTETTASQGP